MGTSTSRLDGDRTRVFVHQYLARFENQDVFSGHRSGDFDQREGTRNLSVPHVVEMNQKIFGNDRPLAMTLFSQPRRNRRVEAAALWTADRSTIARKT